MEKKIKKWEDTILTDEQISKIDGEAVKLAGRHDYLRFRADIARTAVAQAQAKATWKARDAEVAQAEKHGRKEITKFVDRLLDDTIDIDLAMKFKKFKKRWGIE